MEPKKVLPGTKKGFPLGAPEESFWNPFFLSVYVRIGPIELWLKVVFYRTLGNSSALYNSG